MNRETDKDTIDFVADFITDDSGIFESLPDPPPPPARKRSEPKSLRAPPPPPTKSRQSRHPLPKPIYPGSDEDRRKKEQQKKNEEQKTKERLGRNRSPFGDSLERAIDEMMFDG